MAPWIAALPWLIIPLVVLVRMRGIKSVAEYEPARGGNLPRASVIIPARNEALNIERCVRSILLTTYVNIEVIVVDDHSSDGTGDIARRVIGDDARARVTTPPPLPGGWFGKQWACAHGASLATGELLLFTDADTWHAPDVIARSVTARGERNADLFTLLAHQEARGFWEMAGQSTVFLGLMALVGNAETVNKSTNKWRKAANGQYMLVRRDVYDELDGHVAVRMHVAEDVLLAHQWTAAGKSVHVLSGFDHVSTRMYRGLRELLEGWGKNAWAGGAFMWREFPVLTLVLRLTTPIVPLIGWVPIIAFVLGATGVAAPWWMTFGAAGYIYETVMLAPVFRQMRFPVYCALLYPLGCLIMSYIYVGAVIRGGRTEWKGREYVVG